MTTTPRVMPGGLSAHEVLKWSREHVDPALYAAVETLPESLRHIVGYHFGWWDEDGRPTGGSGGKAIRPALALLAAEAVGGTAAHAVPAAVAVELVHNFSLLHDDVMDGDRTRRHRPTAWTVFGIGKAILAGDVLLNLACDVLVATGHPSAQDGLHLLTTAVRRLVEGQFADLALQLRHDVELPECQRMAADKTGALLGGACALGAAFGGGVQEQIGHLQAFGEALGLAFQHVDDLLGIWGNPDRTGKPVHSDLYARKKSLPVVAALNSGTREGDDLAVIYRQNEPLTEAGARHAAKLVAAAGGQAWSHAQAEDLLARSIGHLHLAHPAARGAELEALAGLITHRDQ